MAFDPNSAKEVEGIGMYDANSNTIMAPIVDVPFKAPKFDASTAKMEGGIPFSDLIFIESKGNQFNKVTGKPLISKAGAVGIAQLLPSTGKEAASLAGLPWDRQKFFYDADYNKKLGDAYYNKLLVDFEGDSFKAAAAYNAGPGRVKNIINVFGDKWADKLPPETKNYIAKLGYGGAQDSATAPSPDALDFKPVTPENPLIDYGQLKEAGTFGAGIGALLSAIPQARAITGAVRGGTSLIPAIAQGGSLGDIAAAGTKGAAESILGSIAGQEYQYGKPENTQNDLVRMGIEMATGAGATGLYESGIGLTKKVAGIFPDWASQLVTKPVSALTGKTELEKSLLNNAFGRLKMVPGTSTEVFRNATYAKQADDLANIGISIPKGEIPSDYFRKEMLNSIKSLEAQGIRWKDSNQYKQLMAELDLANIPKDIKTSIRTVANQQGNKVTESADAFEKNLLNLAQQSSGDYKVKDMADIATKLVRKNLDNFFLDNTGIPYYSKLKTLEKEGFAATGRDSIPELIATGFKDKQALGNIKNSEGGVRDLKIAVSSYLRTIPEDRIFKEWGDLKGVLSETHALPYEDIRAITKQVNVAKSLSGYAKTTATLLAKDAIVSALGAEKAKATKDKPVGTITDLLQGKPTGLGAFSL